METIYDETLPVLERIKFPMVWERLTCNVRVEDLHHTRYDDALKIVQNNFIMDDPMCKGCNLDTEEESIQEFLDLSLFWMKDTQSFLAVEDTSGDAVGLLVGRANEKVDHNKTMSRTRIYRSNICGKMQGFQAHINKQVDLFQSCDTHSYYKIYIWCVIPSHRERGIGKALLRTAIEQTVIFNIDVVMGVFTSSISQRIAQNMGFQTQGEFLYCQWKDKDDVIFTNSDADDRSANLMVKHMKMPNTTTIKET